MAPLRESRIFDRDDLHAGTCFGAPGGRALPTVLCEIRQQIEEMLTPKDSMTAPRATCAVATSAALLLQIVQAPSAIWHATSATQKIDNRFSAQSRGASLQTRRQKAVRAMTITNARNRCAT